MKALFYSAYIIQILQYSPTFSGDWLFVELDHCTNPNSPSQNSYVGYRYPNASPRSRQSSIAPSVTSSESEDRLISIDILPTLKPERDRYQYVPMRSCFKCLTGFFSSRK